MDFLTADWESYYDSDYSLSKMTTEAYIRDPRFEPIGISVKRNNEPTVWYSGDNFEGFLSQYDWENSAVLCHNTVFDGAIFSWRFGIKAKLWLDTLSMSRPLHSVEVGMSLANLAVHYQLGEKGTEVVRALGKRRADFSRAELSEYGDYCSNDVELTYKLFKKMRHKLPHSELLLIHNTLNMFIEPMLELDVPLLDKHLMDEKARKLKLLTEVAGNSDPEVARKIIMSNDKLAALLNELGVEPPTKISPTTGKTTWAFAKTDKAFLAMEDHDDPRVRVLASARLGVKSSIEETRTENLLAVAARGSLPVMLNYYGAHTGRFSGGDKLNLQNLPRGGNLRKAIKAPKGKVLVACDSSQIEARVVAMLAGQADLIQAFREKRDVYSEFASEVYGRKIDRKRVAEDVGPGFVGKTCILGLGYGMGGPKFRRTLEIGNGYKPIFIEQEEAYRVVALYRSKYHRIAAYWKVAGKALDGMATSNGVGSIGNYITYNSNKIILPNGLHIQYPALRLIRDPHNPTGQASYAYIADQRSWRKLVQSTITNDDISGLNWTRIYGGKVVENITQAVARIVVSEQMNKIALHYPVVMQVHDELICCVDESEADNCKALMEAVMSTPPTWMPDLPVACEAGVGYNYGEAK